MTNLFPIWKPSPSRINNSNLTHFQNYLNQNYQLNFSNYQELHRWSVEHREIFWPAVAAFCKLDFSESISPDGVPSGTMFPRAKWFPNCELNFAQALMPLRDNSTAIIEISEDGKKQKLSFKELHTAVANVTAFLKAHGVAPLDTVAGYLPNITSTVIAMLATTSIGAIWSSCSPDFGVKAVVDRFAQIKPKVLFTVDSYQYNGKLHDNKSRLESIASALTSLKAIVLCGENQTTPFQYNSLFQFDNISSQKKTAGNSFPKFPFDHPCYILFSSGTTGSPKCIVHGAGGTLLQHAKELCLHSDLKENDKILYFTTCGWMMWNWMASSLALKATIVLYNGAPLYPNASRLFEIVEKENVKIFGTSAKYLSAIENESIIPKKLFSLKKLETILSTGSPLLPQQYDYVYDSIKEDICLSSISGGTDIVSCFALGNPTLPVVAGKLQSIGLGMDVDVFDENGNAIIDESGELVCKSPFPSMPVYFWEDPQNEKYKDAYFNTFPKVWRHGDWASIDDQKRLTIYGRSDATLNPGGIRIGSAELYRVVETLPAINEALAIGQPWKGDTRIVMFLKMNAGHTLTDSLIDEIKLKIRLECSPRHVPAKIIAVLDFPKTISGKMVEIAVRNVIQGLPIKNREALANPSALDYFKNIPQLLED